MKTNRGEEKQQTQRFFAEYFYFLEEISRIFLNSYGLNDLQTEWSDDNRLSDKKKLLVYKMDCYCFDCLVLMKHETGLSHLHLEFFDQQFISIDSFYRNKIQDQWRPKYGDDYRIRNHRFLKPFE